MYINKEACELIDRLTDLKPAEAAVLYALAHEVGPDWRSYGFGYADLRRSTKYERKAIISAVQKLVAKNLIAVERAGMTKPGMTRETNAYRFTQNFIDQALGRTSSVAGLVPLRDMTSPSMGLKESKITDIRQKIPDRPFLESGRVNGKENGREKPKTIEEAKAMADAALKKRWGK